MLFMLITDRYKEERHGVGTVSKSNTAPKDHKLYHFVFCSLRAAGGFKPINSIAGNDHSNARNSKKRHSTYSSRRLSYMALGGGDVCQQNMNLKASVSFLYKLTRSLSLILSLSIIELPPFLLKQSTLRWIFSLRLVAQ